MIPVPRSPKEAHELINKNPNLYQGSGINQIPLPHNNTVRKFIVDNFKGRKWLGFNDFRPHYPIRRKYMQDIVTSSVHNDDLLILIRIFTKDLWWFIHIDQSCLDYDDPYCDVSVIDENVSIFIDNKKFSDVVKELRNLLNGKDKYLSKFK